MRIRGATPNDAIAIQKLIAQYVFDGTLLPRSESFIAMHAHHFLVAEVNGALIGCVHLDEYAPISLEALVGKGMAGVLMFVALLFYEDPYLFCICLFFVKFFGEKCSNKKYTYQE